MADNTTLPGTGNVIATDDVGGVHYQITKLAYGALDTATLVSPANPFPATAVDLTASGALAAAAQTVALSMAGGLSGATVQITGTWVGTISFEGTVDGTNWVPINGVIAGTYAPGTSITVNGVVRLTPGGLLSFRVHATAWTSGTATISMRASAGTGGTFANQILPTVAIQNGVISTVNSTTANLAAAAVFTGTLDDVTEYSTVMVTIFASHASATDGLSVQFSVDGTNWDLTDVFTVPAASGKTFSFGVLARYFRIVYTNGGTLTTSLRIQTLYSRMAKKFSSQRPSDGRTNENDFEETLGYLMGFDGTNWHRLRSSVKGAQGGFALMTQDMKDTGRNQTNYFMAAQIITTATDALQSLTGYKSGAAVTATTTPAVVTTGKTFRVTHITATYVGILTAGAVRFTLRCNTAGVVAIGSPAVSSWMVGANAATAGVAQTIAFSVPDGMEFAAGSGVGISMVGLNATGTAAAAGYGMISIGGFEY